MKAEEAGGRGTSRKKQSDRMLDIVRERIAAHEVLPGAKLQERQLVAEFGVTRSRVREVFAALEALGLVKRIYNRGTIVCRHELNDVFEIYDVREALEGMCARLAAQNVPPETWQDMVELYAPGGSMEQFVEKKNIEKFFEEYEKLRVRMITAADNTLLTNMLDGILVKTKIIMRRVMILPGRVEEALIDHRAVVDALRDGDAERAETRRRENIRNAIRKLKQYRNWVF